MRPSVVRLHDHPPERRSKEVTVLVRNIIMDRLHLVVSAVRDEVQRRRADRQG